MRNFTELSTILHNEFETLKRNYPTEHFLETKLEIVNIERYNKNPNDPYDIDAYILENMYDDKIEITIAMELKSDYKLDDFELELIKEFGVDEEHFLIWLLYHEYGHIIQMHNIFLENGLDGFYKQSEEMSKVVDDLYNKFDEGQITKWEMDKIYRQFWFESEADQFANDYYRVRKRQLLTK